MLKKGHEVRCIHFKVSKSRMVKDLAKTLGCKLSIKRYASTLWKAANSKQAMLALAAKYANKIGADALLTGDTNCVVANVGFPIVRPLIGLNKSEIVELAKKAGIYKGDA